MPKLFNFGSNPFKHLYIQELTIHSKEKYYDIISGFHNNEALIFFHGFNVSFESAVLTTAQITYDLDFKGTPFLFSWPSRNQISPHAYLSDKESARWSIDGIVDFLIDVASKTQYDTITLIAHSMGTDCMTHAIKELYANNFSLIKKFTYIILAAPDIDAMLFEDSIAPKILNDKNYFTLYASENDLALKSSEMYNGCRRLGLSKTEITILDGMDTIDVGSADLSFLGHSYIHTKYSVLNDLHGLLKDKKRPDDRFGLEKVNLSNSKSYWRFKQ